LILRSPPALGDIVRVGETVMSTDWQSAFDNFGVKTVTRTDIGKSAFVPNADQKWAMSEAGFQPGNGGENAVRIDIEVLNDPTFEVLDTSYYNSMRRSDPTRTPEARMGREFIRWAKLGDEIAIGNIGNRIYAWKVKAGELPLTETANRIASTADESDVLERAREAKGKPPKQAKTVSDFKRNLAVVAGAIARANGKCEMPNCSTALFQKDDGRNFLEVHHIVPLGEGGDDTLVNAAALCPMCHRELHYGAKRLSKRKALRDAIIAKEP
jgi:predicted HNH restriction endonuclease